MLHKSGLHLHVGQYQVLEASGAARAAGLIIILERLEKVGVRLLELSLAEVHLPATLCKVRHVIRQRVGVRGTKKSSTR